MDYLEDLMYQASSEISKAILNYFEIDLPIEKIISEHTSEGCIGISYATSHIINEIESCTEMQCPEELVEEIENILWDIYGA